jgi:peptidoglycan hydrolase-like protein with peptidoglycan-binding domain
VSLGIIPADKAQKACNAVAGGGVTNELPLAQFSKSLKLGDRDLQVHMLQAFLNTHGFVVATSGPGSSGNETDLYGSLTKNAVARFQVAYEAEILTPVGLTSPSGIFGPSSMKKANALIGR